MKTFDKPWEELKRLLVSGEKGRVSRFLKRLDQREAVRAVLHLDRDHQSDLFSRMDPVDAAELVEQLPEPEAADIIELVPPEQAAAIIEELPSDEQADVLLEIGGKEAEAILAIMDPEEAEDARRLSRYRPDVAGGLMITECLSFPERFTVSEVVNDLRDNAEEYRDYDVQYAYVLSPSGTLTGVLRLRDLLLEPGNRPLPEVMISRPVTVLDETPLDDLSEIFSGHRFVGVPVVDAEQRLLGVVLRSDVEEELVHRSDSDYRKAQGIVGGEELRSMPALLRSRRRLSWLSINIVLNVIAASVIAFYEDTLSAVIALAVFLPIVSDMSGCSGNQAVAVSIRELTLGAIRPDELRRVLRLEVGIGLLNGAVLGILLGLVAGLWKGNLVLGLVVGSAMAMNTVVAVLIGGSVPLLLKRLGKDPALASGPILTTITDMCGFFILLSLAAAALSHLK